MTRKPSQGPTLEQVAALAGVGRGTASRVINGSEQVSERRRQAVEAAVAELQYIPNAAARTLKTRRTDTVALVIAESEDRIFGEPFFAGVVRGISTAVSAAGKQLVLLLSQAGARSAHLEAYLSRQHVDGVLLLSLHDDDRLPAVIRSRSLPMVLGGRGAGVVDAPWVDVDNQHGAALAAELLVAVGCREIATITGPLDMIAGRDRYDGFRAALSAADRGLPAELVATGDFSQSSGARAMAELLERRPGIDGVFCANDPMAAAALQVLRDAGRRVPEDVCVVGFDDSPLALTTSPPLTTVRQPPEEMGRAMVEVLLGRLEDPDGEPVETRVLQTSLVERGSTRPRG
ncbi:LacI family DNA-binding transcriptional regulator [Marmoricola sp. RAF53]|uniref:LacI family DNA-binding transcriptional regulator n=1 Tax=Marmoricola sp. RAF53 TaxID=3233059 RepID=UPI003F98AF88